LNGIVPHEWELLKDLVGWLQPFGGLGTQRLAGELDITKTLGAYGDLQRGITQQEMDAERAYRTGQSEFWSSTSG